MKPRKAELSEKYNFELIGQLRKTVEKGSISAGSGRMTLKNKKNLLEGRDSRVPHIPTRPSATPPPKEIRTFKFMGNDDYLIMGSNRLTN